MARVAHAVATHKRHKRILKRAEGQWGGRHRFIKRATESVAKGMAYSFRDRKKKKRDFRALWIVRINAGCRECGISYSKFMHALKKANIVMNRKLLSELAMNDMKAFKKIVETVAP